MYKFPELSLANADKIGPISTPIIIEVTLYLALLYLPILLRYLLYRQVAAV